MSFSRVEFIKSAYAKEDHLYDYPQVLFIGRSNVGKSSLINALSNQKKLAYVSKTPGQTKLVNYYLVDKKFYFVDAPGFGYRKISYSRDNFDQMMHAYLNENPQLKLILYLLDSRRAIQQEDEETLSYLKELGYPHIILFTKCDKLNQSMKAKLKNQVKEFDDCPCIYSSIKDDKMLLNVERTILSYLE